MDVSLGKKLLVVRVYKDDSYEISINHLFTFSVNGSYQFYFF